MEAKIFKNGGSQAVRLPKAYRFSTDTVQIKETPMGLLLISDVENFWDNWYAQLQQGSWDVDFEDIRPTEDEEIEEERDWDGLFT